MCIQKTVSPSPLANVEKQVNVEKIRSSGTKRTRTGTEIEAVFSYMRLPFCLALHKEKLVILIVGQFHKHLLGTYYVESETWTKPGLSAGLSRKATQNRLERTVRRPSQRFRR